MKQRNLIRRLTAALVSGAMALSLCAPALAAADEPAATLQPGTYPEGSIAVVYKDKEHSIVVKENTDDILGDGTLAYADGVFRSTKTIEGLLIDVNPEKTVDIDITVEDGPAVKTVLNTANVHNMTLSGYVPNGPAVNTVYAGCTGSLTVKNTAAQGDAAQEVMFINQSSSEMVLRLSDYLKSVLAPGEMYHYLMNDGPITTLTRSITINAEPTYSLTVKTAAPAATAPGRSAPASTGASWWRCMWSAPPMRWNWTTGSCRKGWNLRAMTRRNAFSTCRTRISPWEPAGKRLRTRKWNSTSPITITPRSLRRSIWKMFRTRM